MKRLHLCISRLWSGIRCLDQPLSSYSSVRRTNGLFLATSARYDSAMTKKDLLSWHQFIFSTTGNGCVNPSCWSLDASILSLHLGPPRPYLLLQWVLKYMSWTETEIEQLTTRVPNPRRGFVTDWLKYQRNLLYRTQRENWRHKLLPLRDQVVSLVVCLVETTDRPPHSGTLHGGTLTSSWY